jgi:hypothetical protein
LRERRGIDVGKGKLKRQRLVEGAAASFPLVAASTPVDGTKHVETAEKKKNTYAKKKQTCQVPNVTRRCKQEHHDHQKRSVTGNLSFKEKEEINEN